MTQKEIKALAIVIKQSKPEDCIPVSKLLTNLTLLLAKNHKDFKVTTFIKWCGFNM